jgi:hypothetical protein
MSSINLKVNQIIENVSSVTEHLPSVIIIHDLHAMSVAYMSKWGLQILGTTLSELKKMGADYFTHYFIPTIRQLAPGLNQIDSFGLPAGTYVCRVSSVRGDSFRKIIKD